MQQALQHRVVLPRIAKKNKQKQKQKPAQKANVFNLVIILATILFSIALLRVVQYALYNQYALKNSRLKTKIATMQQINAELASRKLSLESPQRIESLAKNKLKMIKPESIRYIVYSQPQSKSKVAYVKK